MTALFDLARRLILSEPVWASLISLAVFFTAMAFLPDTGLPV